MRYWQYLSTLYRANQNVDWLYILFYILINHTPSQNHLLHYDTYVSETPQKMQEFIMLWEREPLIFNLYLLKATAVQSFFTGRKLKFPVISV